MRPALLGTIVVLAVLAAPLAHAVTFDDGQVHVIDAGNSFPLEGFEVRDSAAGAPTILHVVPGGQVSTQVDVVSFCRGSSILAISGGELGSTIDLLDTCTLTVSGGSIERIRLLGDAHGNMTDGIVMSSVDVENSSTFEMSGGSADVVGVSGTGQGIITDGDLQDARVLNHAILNISGGNFSGSAAANSSASFWGSGYLMITGGSFFDDILGEDGATANISGGVFLGDIEIDHQVTTRISGGQLSGSLLVLGESLMSIVGTGFNLPFRSIVPTTGSLTGVLADGTPLNVTFGRASTATLELLCPDVGLVTPTTAGLAADQDNYCEDWTGVSQPADDLSRAGLELVDLSLANLSGALLIDADLTDADLSDADLIAADLTGAILVGALYDESTLFPSGNTYDTPPWGLPDAAAPWELEMRPAPEPSPGLTLAMGVIGLAALATPGKGPSSTRRGLSCQNA